VVSEINPINAAPSITIGAAAVPTVVKIPVSVGAPVEETALYL
jgi:hypothetical protein